MSSRTLKASGGPICIPLMDPCLGPFTFRSEALHAEKVWLETHILNDVPLCNTLYLRLFQVMVAWDSFSF